tara:strand:- start:696 stop:1922 length:1227 start_codon:yes stop_codon:yes gene_type:complete
MFRGGRVDSRGTGITSGLADGGRVGYNQGNLVAPLYSAVPNYKSGAQIKSEAPGIFGLKFKTPFLSMKTPDVRFGGSLNFGQSPKDFAEALSEGSAYREYLKPKEEEFETEVTESGDIKFKLDKDGNKIPIDTTDLSLKETIEKKRIEDITDKDPQGADLVDVGLSKKSDLPGTDIVSERAASKKIKKGEGLEGVGTGDESDLDKLGRNTEESTEFTVKDYIKMLGGDKARRRDLSDMLASASAAFLGTGSVKEGLAEFMAKQAASGPSRLEKIEQAAATLDIKDKIASKRAKEALNQTLAAKAFGIDYAIDAQKAAENVSDMSFINAAKYVAKDVYKGNKRMTSPAVIADTIRLKYQAPVTKITKELDQIDTTTLKDGFTVVVTSEGVRVFFKEGDKIERQPGLEIS